MSLFTFLTSIHNNWLVKLCTHSRKTIFVRTKNTCTKNSPAKKDSCNERKKFLEPCCKVAVIAGGSEGIGLATARQLLCEKAKHVVLLGYDTSKGLEAVDRINCTFGKNKCTFIKCDLKENNQINGILPKIKAEFQTVDIFVNTVGIWNETKWDEQIRTNLIGTINFNLAVMKNFCKSNAVLINCAGIQGLQPFPPSPIFSAEHAGIVQLSKNLGHKHNFNTFKIRVLALCTGITTCTEYLDGIEGKMLSPEMGNDLQEYINECQKQKPDACAKAVIELIKYGQTGSVWVVEGSRLFHLEIPDWRKYRILVSQFI